MAILDIHMYTAVKNLSCPNNMFPAETEQGKTLPSSLSSHTVDKYLFQSLLTCASFCAFW